MFEGLKLLVLQQYLIFVKIIAIFCLLEAKQLFPETSIYLTEQANKIETIYTKLMVQFCRNRLKIEQNCERLSLMWVQNYMENLNKILVSKFGNH